MKIYNNNIIDLETFKKVKDSPRRRRQLLNGTLSQDTFQLTNPQLQGFSGIARKIAKETPQLETMCRQLEKILEYDIPRIDIFTGVFYAIKTEAEKTKDRETQDNILFLIANFVKEEKIQTLFNKEISEGNFEEVESFLEALRGIDITADKRFFTTNTILADEIEKLQTIYNETL